MGFMSRRSATAAKKPVVSDDLAPPPELAADFDDMWEQALARVRALPAGTPLLLPPPPSIIFWLLQRAPYSMHLL